ncbi:MAG: DUF4412 domain-containing protein [Bacteroidota bacterium]
MKHIIRALVLGALVSGAAAAQGLFWESLTTEGGRNTEGGELSRFYYMPGRFKAVQTDRGNAVIIRLDKEKMIMVDDGAKTYREMTFAELERTMRGAGAQLDAALERMKGEMENMTEEQRKMMEGVLGRTPGGESPRVEVRKTGETRTISGYRCTRYVLLEGGEERSAVWVTGDVSGFSSLRKEMEQFGKRMAAIMPRGLERAMQETMAGLEGFPIQTEMGGGRVMRVTKVEKRSTPLSEFEPPAGYRREKE